MARLFALLGLLALTGCGVRPECAAPNPPCMSPMSAQILMNSWGGFQPHTSPVTYYPNLYVPHLQTPYYGVIP